jgi:signal transduction histidine kinase/chemotaxis methyl-accepting protein methylase
MDLTPHSHRDAGFPIVGIGASAEGVEACSELLGNLPADPAFSVVVVCHPARTNEHALGRLVESAASIRFAEAVDGASVLPGRVYVNPHDTDLSIEHGVLRSMPRPNLADHPMPIDAFFRSLAIDRTTRAIGVLLSGTGSDGTLGTRAIKAEGGLTFAQDATAKYRAMPRSAVASGSVDFVLSPEEIAQELRRISERAPAAEAVGRSDTDEEQSFRRVLAALRKAAGVDLGQYSEAAIRLRVRRRVLLRDLDSMHEYAGLLERRPSEIRALCDDVLVHATSFFRDPDVLEALKSLALPRLLAARTPGAPIRAWIPGCSSGEEVYTLAITLLEFLEEAGADFPVRIFGTDVSMAALQKARAGRYVGSIALDVSPRRLWQHFSPIDGGYQIVQRVRDRCVFAPHDVTRDPHLSRIDVISGRNLGAAAEPPMLRVFHRALGEEGVLLLNVSEDLGAGAGFSRLHSEHKLWARNPTPLRPLAAEGGRSAAVALPSKQLLAADVRSVLQEIEARKAELHATTQALRTIQDELQRAREEKSAAEEEISAVSREMAERDREAGRLADDLTNVLTSVSLPIVLVGRNGCIRRFTPAAANVLNLIAADIGRPIGELGANIEAPDLKRVVENVIEHSVPIERTVKDRTGRWYGLSVRPYVTLERRVDGAVLVLVDIDVLKRGEQLLSSAHYFAERIVDTVREGLLVLDEKLCVRSANRPFCQAFRVTRDEVIGRSITTLGRGEWNDPALVRALEVVRSGGSLDGLRFERDLPNIGRRSMIINARRFEGRGAPEAWLLLAVEDVTERRETEQRILDYHEKLQQMAFDTALGEERERRRIAADLHDGVGQALALAQIKLVSTRPLVSTKARATIDECIRLVEESIAETRTLTFDLSPPILYDLGLEPAVRWFGEQLEKRYGLQVEIEAEEGLELNAEVAALIFRSVRELLTNVCKHARAPVAKVILRSTDDRIGIIVEDAGVGFDLDETPSGFGLFSVRERIQRLGGVVDIRSAPGHGTRVSLFVPLACRPSGIKKVRR